MNNIITYIYTHLFISCIEFLEILRIVFLKLFKIQEIKVNIQSIISSMVRHCPIHINDHSLIWRWQMG